MIIRTIKGANFKQFILSLGAITPKSCMGTLIHDSWLQVIPIIFDSVVLAFESAQLNWV